MNLKEIHLEVVAEVHTVTQKSQSSASFSRNPQSSRSSAYNKCARYGKSNHHENYCRFKNVECFKCKKRGHISSMCLNKDNGIQKSDIFKPDSQQHTHYVTNDGATGNEVHTDNEIYAIYTISHKRIKPLRVMPKLNGVPVNMEIDTGASLSIINLEVFENLKMRDGTIKLEETPIRFRTYGGETLKPEGVINVLVEYTGQSIQQPIYVVPGKFNGFNG